MQPKNWQLKTQFLNNKTNYFSEYNILLLAIYCAVALLVVINSENSFFWDTVQLGSQHATFYYNNNLSAVFLPDELDSGHIPTFGFYIALVWKMFGRTLLVSHFAMLPFVLGIIYQLIILCKRYLDIKYVPAAVLLITADPTLLSQMTLISPDIPLVFVLLMSLNALLNNKRLLLTLGVALLFLISMRGMMIGLCLLIVDLFLNLKYSSVKHLFAWLLKRSLIYLPALLIFLTYSYFHYISKGWIGYHASSPWAESFQQVDSMGFVRNIFLLGWRLVDFGKIIVWILLIIILIRLRKTILDDKTKKQLLIITTCFLIILPLNMLWAKGLLGHRYLLPTTILASLFCAHLVFSDLLNRKLKLAAVTLWFVILASGNYWIYPESIAKGWDATLAHLPYYDLRHEAIRYLDENRIPVKEVGSFFPNTATIDAIDLNNRNVAFPNFVDQKYVFYSTVYNIDDNVLAQLKTHYSKVTEFENDNVSVIILVKK